MKFAWLVVLVVCSTVACSKGGSKDSGSPTPPPNEKPFEGKLEAFGAQFLNGASLKGGPYLGYRVQINSNVINKGAINIYDCSNDNCSIKTLLYQMNCNFSLLTCEVKDGYGNLVKKGGEYKADAADVGEIQSVGNCHKYYPGGTYQDCFYIVLVDPKLKTSGYYDHLAAEFVPKVGSATELMRYRFKYGPETDARAVTPPPAAAAAVTPPAAPVAPKENPYDRFQYILTGPGGSVGFPVIFSETSFGAYIYKVGKKSERVRLHSGAHAAVKKASSSCPTLFSYADGQGNAINLCDRKAEMRQLNFVRTERSPSPYRRHYLFSQEGRNDGVTLKLTEEAFGQRYLYADNIGESGFPAKTHLDFWENPDSRLSALEGCEKIEISFVPDGIVLATKCLLGKAPTKPVCWETVQELSSKPWVDYSCVLQKAREPLAKLCSSDGFKPTKEFSAYLDRRQKYKAAQKEAEDWLKANPGASQMSLVISTKLRTAENEWVLFGAKHERDSEIENIRRLSAACK